MTILEYKYWKIEFFSPGDLEDIPNQALQSNPMHQEYHGESDKSYPELTLLGLEIFLSQFFLDFWPINVDIRALFFVEFIKISV